VFVPRPETELLLEWGLRAVRDVREPLVVDLCTGSAALALAFAASRPDASVHALEADLDALRWARHNIAAASGAGPAVTLHAGDVRWPDLLVELEGRVDLVVCNPPYVPDGTPVPPEVADWDPADAVFGGPDGLEIIRAVVCTAAGLLRPGGALAVEHDDTHAESVPELLRRRRTLDDVVEHDDLVGRPRFVTARRVPAA
jgi:release factor glutamine methyltransferase